MKFNGTKERQINRGKTESLLRYRVINFAFQIWIIIVIPATFLRQLQLYRIRFVKIVNTIKPTTGRISTISELFYYSVGDL